MLFFASVMLPDTPNKPVLYTVSKLAIGVETGATQLPQMLVTEPLSCSQMRQKLIYIV